MKSRQLKEKLRFLYFKVVRGDGSPEYIARGWSLGVFIGCVVPVFCQLYIAIPLSFLFKSSKIGAIAGTFITTPPTAIVIYPLQIWIGNRLIGGSLTFSGIKSATVAMLTRGNFKAFGAMGGEMIASFFVAGVLWGIMMAPLVYWCVRRMVMRYRTFRAAKAQKKAAKR